MRASGAVWRLAVLGLGTLMALAIVEVGLRGLGLGYGSAPLISDPVLHHAHPPNYVFVVHDPAGEFGGHAVRYDAEGLVVDPDQSRVSRQTPARARVVFMGDSFVEGTQIPYGDSFVGFLDRDARSDTEVRNYGTSSYSPLLYLLQWDHRVRQFRPTHVFLMLTTGDIGEDKSYTAQAVFDKDGRPIAVPGPGTDWWQVQLRKSYTVRLLRKLSLQWAWWWEHRGEPTQVVGGYAEEDPEIPELTANYVLTLAKNVQASGARFSLIVVPSKYRVQGSGSNERGPEFSDRWKQWAARHHIDFVDLVPAFHAASRGGVRLFFDRDIHFTPRGHRVVASVVQQAFPELFRP